MLPVSPLPTHRLTKVIQNYQLAPYGESVEEIIAIKSFVAASEKYLARLKSIVLSLPLLLVFPALSNVFSISDKGK
jgi:hypothetical protein